jgi:uncharacterized delta-60 repeat protein
MLLRATVARLVAAGIASAAGGELDPSFSGDGWLRTLEVRSPSTNYLPAGAEDVALQPDGKIVAVGEVQNGTSHWYFGVFRYLPDGSLDPSFARRGWTALDLGSFEFAHAVAVQRDGKIVVAGETDCPRAICFALVRFAPDGSVDRGFGANGVVRTMFEQCGCAAYDVAVQPDGKLVAAGRRFRYGDAQDDQLFAVARYLPDGRLDRGGYARAVVLAGGSIVAGGRAFEDDRLDASDWVLVRYGPGGRTTVSDFGTGSDWIGSLAAQPDGRIVAAGSIYESQALTRYRLR